MKEEIMSNLLVNADAETLADRLGCLPTYRREQILNDIMFPAWADFAAYWQRRREERVTWSTFALRPHNTYYFLAWAFNKNDGLADRVKQAIALLPPAG